MLNTHFKLLLKKFKYTLNEKLKLPVDVTKSLLISESIEPNHLNSLFIQQRNIVIAQRCKTVYGGCVRNYFCCRKGARTGNMESKTLKRFTLLINFLFIELLLKKKSICNHADFWRRK